MNPAIMELQKAIKQQSEDLRDELSDLAKWEEEVTRKEQAAKKKTVVDGPTLPPIRGTVPSLKVDKPKQKEDPVQVAKDQGNEYFKAGKLEDAIRLYTKGIDMDPDAATTHVLYGNRAMCLLKTGDFEKAERDATKCVQLNRSYAKGFFRRASARKSLKKYREARSDLETVLALIPGDNEAEVELRAVTQLIREEDAKANASSTTSQRKKVVICEVEDDEDDVEETVNKDAADEEEDHQHAQERNQRIERDMETLEQKRREQEEKRRLEALKEEQELQRKRRTHDRVEVIEEEESPKKTAPPPAPPAAVAAAATSPEVPAKNVSRNASEGREGSPAGGGGAAQLKPRNIKTEWTRENIKTPKNFTDFERVYKDVRTNDELFDTLIAAVPAASYKTVFGVNLSPELLVDILKSAGRGTGSRAKEILSALASIPRIGEISLFFNAQDTAVLENVVRLVQSSGESPQEIAKYRKTFQMH